MPDGFLDAQTSLATGAVAAGAVAFALRRSRAELDERTAPLAGLVSAFVFAVQMLNFPVGVGTSGHLLGGTLAAVLVGPWTGVLCLSVVVLVQALLFADGGLTALGTNISLMGVVTVLVGWAVTRALLVVLPQRPASVVPAAFLGALVSVPSAALCFSLLYAVGGAAPLPLGTLVLSMVGWHLVIGLGEAVITAMTVSAVVAVRPDLVRAARGLAPVLVLRGADGRERPVVPGASGLVPARRHVRLPALLGGGLALVLVLAGVVSSFAAASPDGLLRVAREQGFLGTARESVVSWGLSGYGSAGGIFVGVAGVVGVLAVVLLATLVFRALAGRPREPRQSAPTVSSRT